MDERDPKREAKALILARRAQFVAASLTSLGLGACDPPPARDASVWTADGGPTTTDATTVATNDPDDPPDDPPTKDADGDGIPDMNDQCPQIWGQKPSGCPMPCLSIAMPMPTVAIPQKIYFEAKKATIAPTSKPILDEVAKTLKDNPQITLTIEGHCDNTEPATICDKRAEAVRDFLVKAGIAATRLTAKGFGSSVPADTNETEGGRENNRRVVFTRTD